MCFEQDYILNLLETKMIQLLGLDSNKETALEMYPSNEMRTWLKI